jgi:4-alpha-glucanotransferase
MNALTHLADELGISRSYQDAFGMQCEVPPATLQAVCAQLGFPANDDTQAGASLAALRAQTAAAWHASVVTRRGDDGLVDIPLRLEGSDAVDIHWTLTLEDGATHAGKESWSDLMSVPDDPTRRLLRLRFLPHGYHRVDVQIDTPAHLQRRGTVHVIYAPPQCYAPETIAHGARVWALTTQLYSLRSDTDWGAGDFSCLADLFARAGDAGAAGVGLNPLHALFGDDPDHASPYSPSSRLFINPLYLDVTAIEDFAESQSAQELFALPDFAEVLKALRGVPHVDYRGVAAIKLTMLRQLYRSFRLLHLEKDTPRGHAFRAYREREGKKLQGFAVFEALREHFGATDPDQRYWRRWPEAFRDPEGPAVANFAATYEESVSFHAYLQWNAELQLAQAVALGAKLPLGLYGDLAVGFDGGGADAWMNQDTVAAGFSAGAPPDPLALQGQNWGFPPLDPRALLASGYRLFIDVVRANMKYAGALRIDHVLGFMRMFWVPEGRPSSEGTYVTYAVDDLLAIVAIESHRNACLVIGEDLGTLPPRLREVLADAALYSYRIVYFERDGERFKTPGEYPERAAAAVTTHDLPTLAGFWNGADIRLREKFGALPTQEALAIAFSVREHDRDHLLAALRAEGLEWNGGGVPQIPVHRFLARTRAHVVLVQLDDAVGEAEQINVPGTHREYPNWRRRYRAPLAALFADQNARDLFAAMREERPASV